MIERTIPRDISKYESKQVLGLTTRQLCLFAPGAILGVITFFLLRESMSDMAVLFALLVAMPFILFAACKPLGLPLEQYIKTALIPMFFAPTVRKYVTQSAYAPYFNTQEGEKKQKQKKYVSKDPLNVEI